jgi:hypothetical protein
MVLARRNDSPQDAGSIAPSRISGSLFRSSSVDEGPKVFQLARLNVLIGQEVAHECGGTAPKEPIAKLLEHTALCIRLRDKRSVHEGSPFRSVRDDPRAIKPAKEGRYRVLSQRAIGLHASVDVGHSCLALLPQHAKNRNLKRAKLPVTSHTPVIVTLRTTSVVRTP